MSNNAGDSQPPGAFPVRAALLVCLVAFVLGARWAVIDRFGSDLPEWDQWDAEGLHAIVPWYGHKDFLSELVLPHNEHRVVLTKLLNLGLTVANGQWDQRLECAVNAALPALVAAGLFLLGSRGLGRRWEPLLMLFLMGAFGLPLSWRNVVSGFHSQQFFLIGLSFGAIAWLPFAKPGALRWWIGAACAVLALGSMASGLLASAIVIALLAARLFRRDATWRSVFPAFALCVALVAVGVASRTTVPDHRALMAHSAGEFTMALLQSLDWPWSGFPWLSALLWLPWCLLLPRAVARGPGGASAGGFPLILAGLGAWTLLQVMATAYGRGAGAPEPDSRYVDMIVFGQVVNGLALFWLWGRRSAGPASRWALTGLGMAWLAVAGMGMARQTIRSFSADLPDIQSYCALCERNVRSYLATGDTDYLQHREIPYPNAGALLGRIRIPVLRDLLPMSVRQPLSLRAADPSSTFTRSDPRVRQSLLPGPAATEDGRVNGLSDSTPRLENRVTWGSYNSPETVSPLEWSSQPVLPTGDGYLKFEVAGHAGESGAALELRDAASGAILAYVRPAKVPGNAWRAVYVREPRTPFMLVAYGSGPRRWLAFAEPVEMGRLSYWAWRTVRSGTWIACVSAAATGLLLAFGITGIPRNRADQRGPAKGESPFSSR